MGWHYCYCRSPTLGGVDTVIVFDSDTSGSQDPDLEVGIGPLLTIPDNILDFNNDSLVDFPNDNAFGGKMTFEFDECVNVNSFKFVDQDQNNLPVVTAYDSTGAIIAQVSVPNMGESSVQIIALNAACVSVLEINSPTSFAVADFDIDCSTVKGNCVNGSADLTPTGGTPGYTYLWSNGATTQDLTGVPCATYTVTVTDANGCTMTRSVTIAPGTLAIDSLTTVDASSGVASDGSATVYVSGGKMPYSYLWATAPPQSTATATGLSPGSYQVTVTDDNGCTATAIANIGGGTPVKPHSNTVVNSTWNVTLYPNPTQGQVYIRVLSNVVEDFMIRVFDTKGSVVFEDSYSSFNGVNDLNYSFEHLPKGVYQMSFISNQRTSVVRFVLE